MSKQAIRLFIEVLNMIKDENMNGETSDEILISIRNFKMRLPFNADNYEAIHQMLKEELEN